MKSNRAQTRQMAFTQAQMAANLQQMKADLDNIKTQIMNGNFTTSAETIANTNPKCKSSSGVDSSDTQVVVTSGLLPSILMMNFVGLVDPFVYNQGSCGSCAAFSSAGMIAGKVAINSNQAPPKISIQQLLDCVPQCTCETGCNPANIYQYAIGGTTLLPEANYNAYSGLKNSCSFTPTSNIPVITNPINNFFLYSRLSVVELKYLLFKGPISVGINANAFEFVYYGDGILRFNCSGPPNHSLLLTGYGTDPNTGKSYWQLKNSWGPEWGINGLVYLEMRDDWDACGMYTNVPEFADS